jgi:hypothetical protein
VVALGAVVAAIVESRLDPADLIPAALLTAAAAGIGVWSTLRPTNMEYDPSTPLVIATAAAVGPQSAPLVLVGQALILAAVDGVHRRRHPELVVANAGLFAIWHLFVGLGTTQIHRLVGPDPGSIAIGAGLALLTAMAVILNYTTVAGSAWYLFRTDVARPDGDVPDQLRHLVSGTVAGTLVWATGSIGVAVAVAAPFALVYLARTVHAHRERSGALLLELQARIAEAEQRGLLPGHSERVAEAVRRAVGDGHASLAWLHGLASHGGHWCGGGAGNHPELDVLVRSLPAARRVIERLPASGLPHSTDPHAVHVVLAACAWDSRLVPGSPVRDEFDLTLTLGIDADAVEEVVGR